MTDMLMLRRHEKDFMLRRQDRYIKKFDDSISTMRSNLPDNLKPIINPKLDTYAKKFHALYKAEVTKGLTVNDGLIRDLRKSADDIDQLINIQGAELEQVIESKTYILNTAFILLLLFFSVLSVGFVAAISNGISKSMDKLTNYVTSLIKDDEFSELLKDTNNEITILEMAFENLNKHLKKAIDEIKNSAVHLSDATSEIIDATDNVNRSSSDQYSMIEQSATAMEEMTASIQEVAKNANNTSEFVNTINTRLTEATSISAIAQESIGALKDELANSVSAIGELQETSSCIDVLLDSIQGIANQTNLLALNAAIEAARAGEHGRGFAVVADEVRTLSSKTSTATEEVRSSLDQFKSVIDSVVDTVSASSQKGTDGQNHANNAISMMRDMTQKVAEISMMNVQIATSVEEQSTAAEGLNEHIHSIFQASKCVQDANEHTSQATQRLSEVVKEINQSASVFAV